MIEVEIDKGSGFCFGVVTAINSAEKELKKEGKLICLGDIVHNNLEVKRLEEMGMVTIDHETFNHLRGERILFRAHGEPLSTYLSGKANGNTIIDATCPVVLKLQKRIHTCYETHKGTGLQVVIYGKKGHAEVNGLVGQTEGHAIVVESLADVDLLDFSRPIALYSQTTKSLDGFRAVVEKIKNKMEPEVSFTYNDTICRQVANRLPNIQRFAREHDWIYFVAGKKSSNGQMLFQKCKEVNVNSQFITTADDITEKLPVYVKQVGICGATSTPKWLMEKVAKRVNEINREG